MAGCSQSCICNAFLKEIVRCSFSILYLILLPVVQVTNDMGADLFTAVAAGDERAFGQLFARYHGKLAAFVRKFTRNESMAEEVVQDVFLKIWQQREKLPEIRNFDTFIFVLARNHTYSLLRKVLAEQEKIERWASEMQNDAANISTIDSDDAQLNARYQQLLNEAIAKLSPQQQKVFILRKQEGLQYKQIAAILGLSPETVKKYLETAVRHVTDHLQGNVPLALLLAGMPMAL